MTYTSRLMRRLAAAVLLSSVVASLPADGAVRRAKARTTAPKPTIPSTAIIALPLNPVVPAGQRLCMNRTPSGLGYAMLRPGSGAKPAASDVVLVNYVGYLAATGAVFDQGMGSALQVDGVIPGFAEGLRMMNKSGVARFCIPAALGYGATASGPIPANADLVFQVELVDFKTAADVDAMGKTQTAAPAQ
jgi:FKBP-type peptidyl-prolyl cis-trans isomerase FkpA